MRFEAHDPPRAFRVGAAGEVELRDCAEIELAPDEQVTFRTERGAEYDIVRKDWGFYATPSLNGRLERFGLRAVLVRNETGRFFVLLVETGAEQSFEAYRDEQSLEVVTWLDSTTALERVAQALRG